ncbi:MAG: glycosyltransferase family 39 protein [Ktedonobacteraceae bacterium]
MRAEKAPDRPILWSRLALVAVMLLSIALNFYQLGQNGFGNLYYAAGVRSMLDNLHNFFFVSFDPGSFVTLDKPPLGFWLQAISAKLFGFTAFSVLLPQALCGVLAVGLLHHLVRRHFGTLAGLLAALALAISPISVVTNRNNTIDSTLALVMLLGAWAVFRAAETGRLRWLLLCALAIGLGFNIKMMEAYLVVPAYGLLYLLAAPKSLWTRIKHLLLATLLLLVVSLSWMVAVDLTPASQRPWIGSTQNNSEVTLAIGYNGVQRLLGQLGGRGRARNNTSAQNSNAGTPPQGANGGAFPPQAAQNSATPGSSGTNSGTKNAQPPPLNGSGGGMFNTGTVGPLRLFAEPLGGQIGWFLPAAFLGMIAVVWQRRPRPQQDRQQQSLVLWGMWMLTMGVFFSVAGFFHPYYLTVMAPAVAALFGIGVVTMWSDFRRAGWRGWLLPLALLATGAEQIYILSNYPAWGAWLIPLIGVLCSLGVVALVVLRLLTRETFGALRMQFITAVLGIAILSLLVAPTVWSAIPVLEGRADSLPSAGPTAQGNFGGGPGGPGGDNASNNTQLISYLQAHQGSAQYLLATTSSRTSDEIIITTNKPVMALGGFGGSDPILTTSQLASLVKRGTVRYFLLGGDFGGPGGSQQSSLTTWVTQNCTVVPTSQWQSTSSSTNTGPGGNNQLYVCKG